MTTFKEMGLNPSVMKGLTDLGFVEPTPIQDKVIPFILKSDQDLIALAQTGTGKTAAYGLPILSRINAKGNNLQSIIICPTRELCLQICEDIKDYSKYYKGISVTPVYGGASIEIQIRSLKRGTNIVVGTPGRLHDLIRRKVLRLHDIRWLVLDEADEMLDMGFKDDLDGILKDTPATRQTLLFSATMPQSVNAIAKRYMKDAKEISIGEKNIGAANVSHEYYVVSARDRFMALKRILDYLPGVYGILFCRTRRETQEVADKLKLANYDTEALHGDISQNIRTKIMARFKKKQIKLLVATDVAARGIDVSNLTHIINYNLPDQPDLYTHRSGRTGRADKHGVSITIAGPRDLRKIRGLEATIGKKFEYKKVPEGIDICRKQIDNFIQELSETDISENGNEELFIEITEKLKKINKEDLIRHIVTHKFGELIAEHDKARDMNAKAKPVKEIRSNVSDVKLKINLGKRNGFDVKGLFALINSNKKLKGVEIGKISLMAEHSIFAVDKRRAFDVEKQLTGRIFRGNKINISRSGGRVGYQGKSKASQGYQGKKDKRPMKKQAKQYIRNYKGAK